ncbi:class I SAM-dependent methyltransferase [Chloroflexia bacterium SDU3-3]|nr:class I SAM-dependent methyltransferase [Chloroflexia bacterium SDU3-3]
MRFAILVAHYLGDVLARHPAPGRRALDLACGTGTLALMLADEGWDVLGVDGSQAMLALARAKAAALETAGRASFALGDMRSFALGPQAAPGLRPSSYHLATCTYDSLNYLLREEELAACFANVAHALAPGGLFFADMNTRHFLEHDWDPVIVDESEGFVQISQSDFDPASACSTMVVTGFAGDDVRGYQRFEETHVERAYPPETVARLLEQAGLAVEAAYDCFTHQPPYEASQRIAWIARKP